MPVLDVHQDAQRHLDFDNQADEDLINYDSDAADGAGDEIDWREDELQVDYRADEPLDTATGSDSNANRVEDNHAEITQVSAEANEYDEDATITAVQDSGDSHTLEQDQEASMLDAADPDEINFEAEEDHLLDHATVAVPAAQQSPKPDFLEIDYDHEEDVQETQTLGSKHDDVSRDDIDHSPHVDASVQEGAVVLDQSPYSDKPSPTSQHHEAGSISPTHEEDEINWNAGESYDPMELGPHDNVGEGDPEDSTTVEAEGFYHETPTEREHAEANYHEPLEGETGDGDVHAEHFGQVEMENGGEEVRSAEGEAHKSTTNDPDELNAREASSQDEKPTFPAITVQYKGDEYSLFSEGPDGFFSDLSLFEDTMESLLAAFRAELVNEIPADEELIFQVDELGLEYSESHLRENLSGVTLRQIVEVFDLLVKNQYPESSRVLYTYLFLKPSTSKRFESLVESATAGKGLDEVTRLFGSPMPHDADNVAQDFSGAGDYDEHFDSYESGDADGGNEETETVIPSEVVDPQDEANSAEPLDGSTASTSGREPVLSHEAEPTELPDSIEHQTNTELLSGSYDNHTLDDVDYGLTTTPHPEAMDADEEAFEIPELQEEETKYEDHGGPEDEYAHGAVNDASTTETLAEDGETMPHSANLDTDIFDDVDLIGDAPAAQDVVDEIDWREDEPETVGDTDHNGDVVAGAGKRPRVEEELGAEDDQDVKRRRS